MANVLEKGFDNFLDALLLTAAADKPSEAELDRLAGRLDSALALGGLLAPRRPAGAGAARAGSSLVDLRVLMLEGARAVLFDRPCPRRGMRPPP